jgi:hypothetical protein
MNNLVKVLLLGLSMSATSASAALIDGTLLVGGAYTATDGGANLANTTAVSITDVIPNDASGDILADISYVIGTGGSASLTAFDPVSGFIVIDGWTLDIDTLSIDAKTSSALDLSGTGTLWKAGYTETNANWSFSAETASNYSMHIATVVPVPAAVWLFGSGLIGLAGIARRKAC